MRVLFCGDVMGRTGRRAITSRIPDLRRTLALDFVVVNGENAAHGFGLTEKICAEFFDAGVDVVTTGNHAWGQAEVIPYMDREPRLLRPQNYPAGTPGHGVGSYQLADGRRIMIVQVMTRLFMDPLDCPFAALEEVLAAEALGDTADAILVDIHGEATSEKMALGHVLDGRVSAVFGSHTHVPTADAQILPGGTAYQTDAGMCGDYDSVIGMQKERAVERFVRKIPTGRLQPADGEATLCGVVVDIDPVSGLASRVAPLRLGGRLAEALPPVP